jgi:prephenate dehydrogenase
MAVIGVGLIGGSLALALRRRGLVGEIVGVGRGAANLALARRRGIIDRATSDPAEGARGADLVVLATPVSVIAEVGKAVAHALRPGTIVTDVSSVKESVLRDLEAVLPPHARFVAAHPIAGTEDSGAGAATADLFEGSRCILTPTARTDPRALAAVKRMWRDIGARVIELDAAAHDRILGSVSHLPHVVAYALVNAVTASRADALAYAGGGFRDFTRIAASHAGMWRDIVLDNRANVLPGIDATIAELSRMRALIERGDAPALEEAFDRARITRRALGPGAARPVRGGAAKRATRPAPR